MVKEKDNSKTLHVERDLSPKELVLHNDDFNTFDFVINSLVEICNHDPIQAEQCTLVVHNNGKCTIMTGSFAELEPLHKKLSIRKLTTTIEK